MILQTYRWLAWLVLCFALLSVSCDQLRSWFAHDTPEQAELDTVQPRTGDSQPAVTTTTIQVAAAPAPVQVDTLASTFLARWRGGDHAGAADLLAFAFAQKGRRLEDTGDLELAHLDHLLDTHNVRVASEPEISEAFRLRGQPVRQLAVSATHVADPNRQSQTGFVVHYVDTAKGPRLVLYGEPGSESPLILVMHQQSLKTRRTVDDPNAPVVRPERARTANDRGMRHYSGKRYGRALAEFQKAQEADPYFFFGHFNAACVLSIQNQREDALSALKQARLANSYMLGQRIRSDSDLKNLWGWPSFETWAQTHFPVDIPPQAAPSP